MNQILTKIGSAGIVPVIKINDVDKAVPLARALSEGGINVAEVTFRTSNAAEAISRIVKDVPDMLVGAGTVLTCEQANKALDAGARFIVSPGMNPKVVEHCVNLGIPITPGVNSPSEIEAAIELGLDALKFFPAEQSGGTAFLSAVSATYSGVKFIPTGGINAKNLNDYLSLPNVLACGGSWMVKPEMIDAGDFAGIAALARDAVKNMMGFELAHVGINLENSEQAEDCARSLCSLFGFAIDPGKTRYFAGTYVECMIPPCLGQKGHIGFKTNSLDRAIAHLSARGIRFNESSRKVDDKGKTKLIYLSDEIYGFAIHITQK